MAPSSKYSASVTIGKGGGRGGDGGSTSPEVKQNKVSKVGSGRGLGVLGAYHHAEEVARGRGGTSEVRILGRGQVLSPEPYALLRYTLALQVVASGDAPDVVP
jgi:hypothetical protein